MGVRVGKGRFKLKLTDGISNLNQDEVSLAQVTFHGITIQHCDCTIEYFPFFPARYVLTCFGPVSRATNLATAKMKTGF